MVTTTETRLPAAHHRAFLLAGEAIFTLVSQRTGARFTYRISRALDQYPNARRKWVYYVSWLTGPNNQADYTYLGVLDQSTWRLKGTKASPKGDLPSWWAAEWALPKLLTGKPTPELEVWHAGLCGRCGAVLTHPESIACGLGPVCREVEEG